MDPAELGPSPTFLFVREVGQEGPANLHAILALNEWDNASSVPDATPCVLLLTGKCKGGPSQVLAMLVHWGGSRFGYLYTDLPAEGSLANLTATPLFSDGLCLVIYSPES